MAAKIAALNDPRITPVIAPSSINCRAAILAAINSCASARMLIDSFCMARPPRIPVWLPADQEVVYFITLCVADRQHTLDNPDVFGAMKMFCSANPNWLMLAAVIMPDHLHALVSPLDRDAPITQFSAGLKRHVRRVINAKWKWQDGVFDRLLRREESAEAKWNYTRENPVRAGLVSEWDDWPYYIGLKGNDGGQDGRPTKP